MWEVGGVASCTQTQQLALYRQLSTSFRLVVPAHTHTHTHTQLLITTVAKKTMFI